IMRSLASAFALLHLNVQRSFTL
ncbi:putative membrane protein, partial [Vibrio parahaemolyticus V-223/04]